MATAMLPDGVFDDQIPADNPRDQLAHRGVGVGVSRTRDGNSRCKFGVAKRGKGAGDCRENEQKNHRRTAVVRRFADHCENARADNGGDAHQGQIKNAERAFERSAAVFLRVFGQTGGGIGLQPRDRFFTK